MEQGPDFTLVEALRKADGWRDYQFLWDMCKKAADKIELLEHRVRVYQGALGHRQKLYDELKASVTTGSRTGFCNPAQDVRPAVTVAASPDQAAREAKIYQDGYEHGQRDAVPQSEGQK